MALLRERELNQIGPHVTAAQAGIAANAEAIWESGMVLSTATGYVAKVGDGTVAGLGNAVVGIARFNAIGGTTDGEKSLDMYHGVFARPNSTTTPVTWASFSKRVYAEDDEKLTSDPAYPVAGTMWGFTEKGEVIFEIGSDNAAMAAAGIGEILLPLASFYEANGTPLAAFADGASPTPGLSLNDSEAAGIRWNNDAAPGKIVSSFAVPSDLDITKPAYVLLTAAKTGTPGNTAADVPKFTVELFEHPVGSAYDAGGDLGGLTNAMANPAAKTVQGLALTIPADTLSSPAALSSPATATITLQPEAGKLGTDDLVLLSARVIYTPAI